ncbi:MAG: hypothetical protein HY722_07760 [Planctomycetes bacterium]|nr:hypothetical protein [Planctomycetota bacterium]
MRSATLTRAGPLFDLARPEDEPELRRIARENEVPGEVTLGYEREPDFGLAGSIEGDRHQVLVARMDEDGPPVAVGTRAEMDAWVNGASARVGYLSQLRIDRASRHRRDLLLGGFAALRRLHEEGGVPYYVTTIIEENHAARRLLGRGLPGLPTYREVGPLSTLVLPLGRGSTRRGRRALEGLAPGRPEDLEEVAALLARERARRQFAPRLSARDLADPARSRGLAPGDFLLDRAGGRLRGCVAVWDQRAFKQLVVRGYSGRLGRARPFLDLASRLLGTPRLPDVGEEVRLGYLAHLSVEGQDLGLEIRLVTAAAGVARARGLDWLCLGLAGEDPLLAPLRLAFRPLEYRSVIYLVHWEDGAEAVSRLDGRPPRVEVAAL